MALRPGLAEGWERINAQSLRLFLRKGVAFHDGTSLTAEDVAFSLGPDHLLGPGRRGMSQALQSLDRLEKVEIVDPFTGMPRAATRSSSSVWLFGDRRSSVSAPSWRRARGSGGPQPLLEAILTSSSTTSSIFVSRWLPTIRGGVGRRSMASNSASFRSVPRA
ncbi:ABC transporter substrate-binding protein [Bradyrhizobium sp. CW7]|uniref:ABC transporter substrate-binding protein n=1 Tax=Bradyrhizobium sp. CW7 TaxID=2782688 RepID=UPI001FF73A8C|nr:ABC transporter substrate-binding protein [Bradyrhizobium sp. CW7]